MIDRESIMTAVETADVKYIRLQFTDIFGKIKSVFISAGQLDKALNNKCMFDGSSIEGFVRIEESDMILKPDMNTFCLLPIDEEGGKEARFICDIYTADGNPFEGDPRYILRRAVEDAQAMGYDFKVGPECEFFLFKMDEDGEPTLKTVDDAGYFDIDPVDIGARARKEMCTALEAMGFEIEAAHHECARGQHEIDFKYARAVHAADNIMTLKAIVKVIAKRFGLHATFMPKPIFGVAGSGMHTNMSLWKDGKNAFSDENDPNGLGLSQDTYHFIGGLIKHAKAVTAITNPIVNSYKRLVPGYEAPVYIAWSAKNRSPLIRIPHAKGNSARVELRSPDCVCNPYLAFAAVLQAGLDGIRNQIQPAEPVDSNIYCMDDDERECRHIDCLPHNLLQAVEYLEQDEVLRAALGEHVFRKFIKAKTIEYHDYSRCVHNWETEQYFSL